MLTKNDPIQKTYRLADDGRECVEETIIENFEPYSRVIYVRGDTEEAAQRKLFEYMYEHGIQNWKDLDDGTILD